MEKVCWEGTMANKADPKTEEALRALREADEAVKELRELTGAKTDGEAVQIALNLAKRDIAGKPPLPS